MPETAETKPKEPAPKRSRWWWAGPLLVTAVVGLGFAGWKAWKHHQFEKERTETPPHVVADPKLKLLWIPAGTFVMGTEDESEWLKSLKGNTTR